MRTYDFAPLWRSSIGFDRVFDQINNTELLEGSIIIRPTILCEPARKPLHLARACRVFAGIRHHHRSAEFIDGGWPLNF